MTLLVVSLLLLSRRPSSCSRLVTSTFFLQDHHALPLRGFEMRTLRAERKRRRLVGKVEVHHIVPRQLRSHPTLLRFGYEVEEGYNLVFLPTREGILRTKRPPHTGGHYRYNEFCRQRLDGCESASDLLSLLLTLRAFAKGRTSIELPWR